MRVNSSSSVSLLSPLLCFSNSTLYPRLFTCFDYKSSFIILMVFTFANCLLLFPLCVLVLWVGVQRWRHQCSVTAASACDSDVFIYHIVTVEIISVLGTAFLCCAIYTCSPVTIMVGYYCLLLSFPGQTFFHCLTCVERYLAVVHPITYRGLKKAGGVKVRNVGIGCVWLLCFALIGFVALYFPGFPSILFYGILTITICVIYFCSLSVLFVLIRLGLWKVGGDRERTDKSKQRAFYTVMGILGALLIRLCGLLFFGVMLGLEEQIGRSECVVLMSGVWLYLPSSLILPLLFLHRAGALACSREN